MSFGFLGIQFGWGLQLGNMSYIYKTLHADADKIPLLWLAGPMTGLLVQPIIGSMSDRTWNRLGRRRPYFLTGAILASIALFWMPNSPALWFAAGLLWIPALLEGAGYLAGEATPIEADPNQGAAQNAAELAGLAYARFVEDEFIYGAGGNIDLAPSSEDGYHAVMAYVALYEATRKTRWLTLACLAADWMLSFRWSYNLLFPEHTLLKTYDFRTRGADLASPRNQHLHGYGLICLPEMVRLAEHSQDPYYLERTRDNLACFLQFIAREDGDFNARKGIVTERYFNSRGFGPKGAILPIAHARSAGLVLYACQAGLSLDE